MGEISTWLVDCVLGVNPVLSVMSYYRQNSRNGRQLELSDNTKYLPTIFNPKNRRNLNIKYRVKTAQIPSTPKLTDDGIAYAQSGGRP